MELQIIIALLVAFFVEHFVVTLYFLKRNRERDRQEELRIVESRVDHRRWRDLVGNLIESNNANCKAADALLDGLNKINKEQPSYEATRT